MKKFLGTTALAILAAGAVHAGGLDRSGQSVAVIFEEGRHLELSFGSVNPSVTGNEQDLGGAFGFSGDPSGNIAPTYSVPSLAYKADLNDALSYAVILDTPFGTAVEYAQADYVLNGTDVRVNTLGLTAVINYDLGDGFSVHAGPRLLQANGHYNEVGTTTPHASTYSTGYGLGFVAGAAYEMPEIALRVALTYSSEISMELDGSNGDLSGSLPQSVNLEFQSGIAEDTLLFGSVRWADWTSTVLVDDMYPGTDNIILDYDDDVLTYSLGVGRRFSDTVSAAVTFGFEAATGDAGSNLSPTDGYRSIGVGVTQKLSDVLSMTFGARYVVVGDTTTAGINSDFSGNSVTAFDIKWEMKL